MAPFMMRRIPVLAVLVALTFPAGLNAEELSRAASKTTGATSIKSVGRRIPNFVLSSTSGGPVGLADFAEKRLLVVLFSGTACPIGNAYLPALAEMRGKYRAAQVEFIAINSVAGDTPETIAKHARDFQIPFPVLIDAEQAMPPLFGATRLSEVFVLDERRVVRYQGRIDDQIGFDYRRDEPRRRDLAEALDDLLAGKPVSVAATDVAGCLITLRERQKPPGTVTWREQAAEVFRKHCVDCHHPGTAAPFSLLKCEEAAQWADMVREVVEQRRMPPWHADPRFGEFSNARRLTQPEIDMVVNWANGGAPEGVAPTTPAVSAPHQSPTEGWRIGRPDAVFSMPVEYTVPAQGKVNYQYFTTPTNFKEDVWVQAAEARPGNRAAVHHIIVFYRDPEKPRRRVWIASTAPGADPVVFPPGLGRKIPAGAELVWQVHYTATGKEEHDRSEIGLVFCKQPPQHNVENFGISNTLFRIPPGAANYKVESSIPVVKDAVILSLYPHTHVRGKDFEYVAEYPDGRKQRLLSVPQYDFNWQNTYRLKTPLHLPKGAWIRCTAHYDNSAANPANPDPAKSVGWGDQTWDEMMIGYIDFYYEDESGKTEPGQKSGKTEPARGGPEDPDPAVP